MIEFDCPYCGRATRAQDQYAGRVGKCKGCGRPVTVPDPTDAPEIDDGDVIAAAFAGNTASHPSVFVPQAAPLPAVAVRPAVAAPMPPEPWYYGFLFSYGMLIFQGGIVLGVLMIVVGVVVGVVAMQQDRTGGSGVVVLLAGVCAGAALVVTAMFLAAPILLMVDVARHIRATRYRS